MGNCQCQSLRTFEAMTEVTSHNAEHDTMIAQELIEHLNIDGYNRLFGHVVLIRAILGFLTPLEQIKMQILNRHWYSDKGMGLYMSSIIFEEPFIDIYSNKEPYCFMLQPSNNIMLLSVYPEYEITRVKIHDNGKPIVGSSWRMVQIGTSMFITGGDKTPKQCLKLRKGKDAYHKVSLASLIYNRCGHAVCSYAERFIFASGSGYDFKQASTVECYDSQTDKWTRIPNLRIARYHHASCSVGDSIYVICGGNQSGYTDTIEKFNLHNQQAGWLLISISGLDPLDTPGATALNTREILIFGGNNTKTNRHNSVSIVDLGTSTLENVALDNSLPISPEYHQTVLSKPGCVVTIDNRTRNMLEFDRQENTVKVLVNLM